jgi:two-component system cell cycle response regulator DivK
MTSAQPGARVLLVDDNEASADMLRRRLERRGFVVIAARDGRSGVAAAEQEQPDLVLMDLSLPEIDGWQATRLLKANPATSHIPVVALTAHAFLTDRQRSLEAGCDEFETKPVNFDALLAKIHAILIRRAQHV